MLGLAKIDSTSICFVVYRYEQVGHKFSIVPNQNTRKRRKNYSKSRMVVQDKTLSQELFSVCVFEKDDPDEHTVIHGIVGDKWYNRLPVKRHTCKSQLSAISFIIDYYESNIKNIDDVTEEEYDYDNCFKESRAVVISKKDYLDWQKTGIINTPTILVNGKRYNRTRHHRYFLESLTTGKVAEYRRGYVVYW